MNWDSEKTGQVGMWARIIGILMISVTGYIMMQEKLWNGETRVLLFGFWLCEAGLLSFRKNFRIQIHYFIISTLGGFLVSLGFPPSPLFPFIMVGFVALFYLENECYLDKLKLKWFLLYVFNFFLIWNFWTTYWIVNTAFFPGIVGMLINSMLMTLTVWWAHWIHRRVNVDWYFGGVFIACWLSFEFIHLRWELSWPWLTIGNALAEYPFLAQWYEYTGALGGTFWVLGANFLLFKLLRKSQYSRENLTIKTMSSWLALLLIPCIISGIIFYTTDMDGKKVKVVVVNPDIEPHYEKFNQDQNTRWLIYKNLLDKALSNDPDLIMLPETIFEQINLDNISGNGYIRNMQNWLEKNEVNADILLGVTSFRIFDDKELPDRSSVRTSTGRDGQVYHWEVYNSAILMGEDTIPVYHKQKLVPGAEIFPYRGALFFLQPVVDQLGGSIFGYGQPSSQNVFLANNGIRIAPIICYESVYGEYMRKNIAQGANLLGVITNDGWWGNTAGHIQHYMFAALRAIEFRRSLVRSANLGFNGAFDVRGQSVVSHNDYNEQAVIPVTVTLHDGLSFYALWGDYLGRFSIMFVLFFTLKAMVNMVLDKNP